MVSHLSPWMTKRNKQQLHFKTLPAKSLLPSAAAPSPPDLLGSASADRPYRCHGNRPCKGGKGGGPCRSQKSKNSWLTANMMLSGIGELTIDPLDVFYVYIPQNLIESMCYLDVIFLKSFIFVGYYAFLIGPYVDGHTSQEYKTVKWDFKYLGTLNNYPRQKEWRAIHIHPNPICLSIWYLN